MRPHQFDSLIGNRRRPNIFAGAGLSAGIAPRPNQLLQAKKNTAEASLGVTANVDLDGTTALYEWADAVLSQLNSADGPPKLRVAQALGIVDDAVWAARTSYPASGLSPRHRILARFAREDLWQGVWTWNWDCLLESALEAIGFERGPAQRTQPWLTRFDSVVVQDDFGRIGDRDLLCVLKPHGCAARLADAIDRWKEGQSEAAAEIADRFMIGQRELTHMRDNPTDRLFFDRMRTELSSHPSLIVGWSVSEPYLQAVIDDALGLLVKKGKVEELSIVDIAFNDAGHRIVSECYGLTRAQVFFEVAPSGPGFTADSFFLWIQSLLSVARMAEAALDHSIRDRILEVAENAPEELVFDWCDSFLPSWNRLCWRGGLVPCAGFQPHQIAIDNPEEYIPLTLPGVLRPDLAAAGRIFSWLQNGSELDFVTFPGAIWLGASMRLILPLPYWDALSELEALKPLMANQNLPYVERLDVYPVHFDPAAPPATAEVVRELKQKLSNALSHPTFSDPSNIGIAASVTGEAP